MLATVDVFELKACFVLMHHTVLPSYSRLLMTPLYTLHVCLELQQFHNWKEAPLNAFVLVTTIMSPLLTERERELHSHTTQQQPLYSPLSGTTRVSRYQKKHSSSHHPDHHPIFITFFNLPRSIASSLFKLRAWQSFCTTSFHVLFGLPLGLEPSTSYSIRFFKQSVSSFHSICPYHRNLFLIALWNRAGHYIFILSFVLSFFLLFFLT